MGARMYVELVTVLHNLPVPDVQVGLEGQRVVPLGPLTRPHQERARAGERATTATNMNYRKYTDTTGSSRTVYRWYAHSVQTIYRWYAGSVQTIIP